ncbi:nef attachable domain protein [Chlamydia psittaci 03DC29]
MKKEISSVKNWKEVFLEIALCSVNSSHRVTAFPYRNLSLRLFFWHLQCDISKPIEGYGEKGNILR